MVDKKICFLELSEEFPSDSKRIRIINGKRAIRIPVIEAILYMLRRY